MKVSLCSLALLSFLIFSIKNHNAYPYSNLSQIQFSPQPTLSPIMASFDPFSFSKNLTTSITQNKTSTYDPYTYIGKSTTSITQNKPLIYDPFVIKSTTPASTSTSRSKPDTYDPYTQNSTTSISQSKPPTYNFFTNKPTAPELPSTLQTKPYIVYDPYFNKLTSSTSQSKFHTYYNPYTEKFTSRNRVSMLTYNSFTGETSSSSVIFQTYRNRYNIRRRFRNPIITIVSPLMTTSHRASRRFVEVPAKTERKFKFDDIFQDVKNYAYIRTALNSTPMVHLNITIPRVLLEGKFSRLASPYIIRITLPRKLAARSNATLPNRGFLRIVGSPINMIEDGNLGLVLGKIANQIGNAYNMSGKDLQKMGHVIVVGPAGQMINRKATPPKKTTLLTSQMMMTARLRLRLNCTLPKITDQVIYFEDYIKYFELY